MFQPLNPGNLKSDLQRTMPMAQKIAISWTLHEPILGAYTLLFAGLSTDVTMEKTGHWSEFPNLPGSISFDGL
jgi:retinol dehydrogenase-12